MAKEDDQRQQRLGGSTPEEGDGNNGGEELDDFGNERPYWRTLGGHRRDLVNSLMQKAVRRSDTE